MYFSILVIDFGWKKKCLFLIVVRVVLLFSHKNHVQCISHIHRCTHSHFHTCARVKHPSIFEPESSRKIVMLISSLLVDEFSLLFFKVGNQVIWIQSCWKHCDCCISERLFAPFHHGLWARMEEDRTKCPITFANTRSQVTTKKALYRFALS